MIECENLLADTLWVIAQLPVGDKNHFASLTDFIGFFWNS